MARAGMVSGYHLDPDASPPARADGLDGLFTRRVDHGRQTQQA